MIYLQNYYFHLKQFLENCIQWQFQVGVRRQIILKSNFKIISVIISFMECQELSQLLEIRIQREKMTRSANFQFFVLLSAISVSNVKFVKKLMRFSEIAHFVCVIFNQNNKNAVNRDLIPNLISFKIIFSKVCSLLIPYRKHELNIQRTGNQYNSVFSLSILRN